MRKSVAGPASQPLAQELRTMDWAALEHAAQARGASLREVLGAGARVPAAREPLQPEVEVVRAGAAIGAPMERVAAAARAIVAPEAVSKGLAVRLTVIRAVAVQPP